mgnify:CR=1 FL=1
MRALDFKSTFLHGLGLVRCETVPVYSRSKAKRQVRGGQESPEMGVCCLSNRLNMFDSAIESLTHVDSNALFRF